MYARVQFRKPKMLNDSLAFSIYLFVLELIILLIMIRKSHPQPRHKRKQGTPHTNTHYILSRIIYFMYSIPFYDEPVTRALHTRKQTVRSGNNERHEPKKGIQMKILFFFLFHTRAPTQIRMIINIYKQTDSVDQPTLRKK